LFICFLLAFVVLSGKNNLILFTIKTRLIFNKLWWKVNFRWTRILRTQYLRHWMTWSDSLEDLETVYLNSCFMIEMKRNETQSQEMRWD
jgi:hypothetical protein